MRFFQRDRQEVPDRLTIDKERHSSNSGRERKPLELSKERVVSGKNALTNKEEDYRLFSRPSNVVVLLVLDPTTHTGCGDLSTRSRPRMLQARSRALEEGRQK